MTLSKFFTTDLNTNNLLNLLNISLTDIPSCYILSCHLSCNGYCLAALMAMDLLSAGLVTLVQAESDQ